MFFHLTGIKDIAGKNYTLDILIEGEDASSVKAFFSGQKVVIIGLEKFDGVTESFGQLYATLQGEKNKNFKIVSNIEDIETFLSFLLRLDFQVLEINSAIKPLSQEESSNLIKKYQDEERRYQEAKEQKTQKETAKEASFHNRKLQKAYTAIDEVIDQIDQISTMGGNAINPNLMKKLDDTRAEISKLRLATNYDKIIEELEKGMNLIIESQNIILEKIDSSKVFPIIKKSQISNIDVIKEQTRLSKINLMGELGAQLTPEENIYFLLKKNRSLLKFLQKDVKESTKDTLSIRKNVFSIINVVLLFLIVELAIVALFFPKSLWADAYGLLLFYFWLLAVLFSIIQNKIAPKTTKMYLWTLLWLIAVYALLVYFSKLLLVL